MSTPKLPVLPQRTPAPVLEQHHDPQPEPLHPETYAEIVAEFDGFDPHFTVFTRKVVTA